MGDLYLFCMVYGTLKRSSVFPSSCLSVCPIDRQQQRRAEGLLLSVLGQEIPMDSTVQQAPALSSSAAAGAGAQQ